MIDVMRSGYTIRDGENRLYHHTGEHCVKISAYLFRQELPEKKHFESVADRQTDRQTDRVTE